MKLHVLNTKNGLIPIYSVDFDEKKKLKVGNEYQVEVKKIRNPKFHRKYFALLNMAYDNLNEKLSATYPNIDIFRKSVQVMAGYCEIAYTLDGEQIITPKSISFAGMDETEFESLYNDVLDVLIKHVFIGMSKEFIDNELINFM